MGFGVGVVLFVGIGEVGAESGGVGRVGGVKDGMKGGWRVDIDSIG